jgi:hypothetical protein
VDDFDIKAGHRPNLTDNFWKNSPEIGQVRSVSNIIRLPVSMILPRQQMTLAHPAVGAPESWDRKR